MVVEIISIGLGIAGLAMGLLGKPEFRGREGTNALLAMLVLGGAGVGITTLFGVDLVLFTAPLFAFGGTLAGGWLLRWLLNRVGKFKL